MTVATAAMNLTETPLPKLRRAFNKVEESRKFFDASIRQASSNYSLHAALTWLAGVQATAAEIARVQSEQNGQDYLTVYRQMRDAVPPFTVYGAGGFHRYLIRPTGEILFSKRHASDKGLTLAADYFGIFE